LLLVEVFMATYGAAAGRPEPALVRALLVARRRVDGVGVDVSLLRQGLVPDLRALRRGVHEGGPRADREPAVQGLDGDEAVVRCHQDSNMPVMSSWSLVGPLETNKPWKLVKGALFRPVHNLGELRNKVTCKLKYFTN